MPSSQAIRVSSDRVRFTGPLPHEDVGRFYGLIDLFVLPRRPNRLTDLVTPLKPLEIMARAKPVLASDCGGHRELIVPGTNGFLYNTRVTDGLANAIRDLVDRRSELSSIGARARAWVAKERSWQSMVAPTVPLYERLVGRHTAGRVVARAAGA